MILSLKRDDPLFFDYRVENNDQWDFIEVILLACQSGVFKRGDYLICDNATVHHGSESSDVMDEIMKTYGMC